MPAILWAGGEASDFSTAIDVSTTASHDSNFSRCCFQLGQGSNVGNYPAWTDASGTLKSAWFHYRWGDSGSAGSNNTILTWETLAGQGILRIIQVASSTVYRMQYWSGSAWTNIGATFNCSNVPGHEWDFLCNIDSVAGEFAVYVDGVLADQLTGNTDFFGAAIGKFRIGTTGQFLAQHASEGIIADIITLGMRLATLAPNGNGNQNTWSAGGFGDIDEIVVNDADFMQSNTANQVATFAAPSLSATAALLIPVAYKVGARVRNAVAGPQNMQVAARSAGTDYFSATLPTPTTSFSTPDNFQNIWMLDPGTGVNWTVSGINAVEPGIKSIT